MFALRSRRAGVLASIAAAALVALHVPVLPAVGDDSIPYMDWTKPVSSKSHAATHACADYLFIGARGSGETDNFGSTVRLIRSMYIDGAKETTKGTWYAGDTPYYGKVRSVYLDYTAADTKVILGDLIEGAFTKKSKYFNSIQDGVKKLKTVLDSSAKRCKSEKWLLAGYSQGAVVVNQYLESTIYASRIRDVALIGDPDAYKGRGVQRKGTAPSDARGVYDRLIIRIKARTSLRDYSVSFCNNGDLVCDYVHAAKGTNPFKLKAGLKVHASYKGLGKDKAMLKAFKTQGTWLPSDLYHDRGFVYDLD